jgi:anaerobic magnesium-protoporphyrin IX monomethyl ester cyclase
MRIVFVNVPNTYELIGNDPVIIKDQQGIYPPLGLLSIAGYLIHNGYDDVHVLDAQVDNWGHSELAEKVAELKPDIVGITAMTFTLIDVKLTVEEIRKRVRTTIVIGGPHVSIYPEETLELGADYAIVGEGEITFLELIKEIRRGTPTKRIYKQERFIEDLDALPFPARELTPINKYYSVLAENTPTTTAFSSRGCPYQCTYCDRPALGKAFRSQSPKRVVDEMEWCERKGIKEIFFYDDTFTILKSRVIEICKEYQKRHLSINWDIRARVNTVDEETLGYLSMCGLTRIHFGVESASVRVLQEINKNITPAQVYRAFELCRRFGIKTLAYFMMGTPTETLEDINTSLKMAKEIQADYMQMTILSLFPGTKVYDLALKNGLVPYDVWKEYVKKPTLEFRPPMWETIYSRKEHEEHLRWFYKKFYLRPRFIWDRLCEIRNPGQLRRYTSAGLSLIRMSLQKESKAKIETKRREAISS